jgi:predicted dehydrogenase
MLRLGIVGCGKVTTMFHIKAIEEVEEVEVTAVADLNEERVEEVRRRAGAERGYTNYRELLSDPDVDAVAVNTPPRFHEEMVLESIRAGKHVLCEKPLARSVEGCVHVRDAQEASGLVVLPVHNYTFTPCLETALDVMKSGELGGVERIGLRFYNNLWSYGPKTDYRLEEMFAIVGDLLPHVLSVAHVLGATVNEIKRARGWRKSYKVIDNLSLLGTGGEVELDCSMNWTSLIPAFNLDILGDSGSIRMDLMKRPYRVSIESPKGKRSIDEKGLRKYLDLIRLKHPAFEGQYRHFHGLVEGVEPARFTIDDEIGMLRVVEEVEMLLSETDISRASAISSG